MTLQLRVRGTVILDGDKTMVTIVMARGRTAVRQLWCGRDAELLSR